MAADELLASVEVYQVQLQQIESALAAAGSDEKCQLQELQANILQLLDLTLQQLNQHSSHNTEQKKNIIEPSEAQNKESTEQSEGQNKDSNSLSSVNSDSGDKNIDDEFALFQSEIAALSKEKEPEEPTQDKNEDSINPKYTKEELENLVGSHCRSPFVERWGGQTYHNAVVLSLVTSEDGEPDLEEPQVRVLFSQPTSLEMLTCHFFLDDRCKYSEEKCRFSHGKIVAASDLKEYRKPDFDSVVCGSRVLVQNEGDLWRWATVMDILEDRSAFSVLCDKSKEVREAMPQDMFPVHCDMDGDEEDDTEKCVDSVTNGSDSSSEDEAPLFIPGSTLFQNSLSQRLGDWEKYTKGIGSKLMAKMGYVVGTGLGRDGTGRVEPVPAYVYPQGVSLDHCMELREASNGEKLLQVEKRLEREKKKVEAISAQTAERIRKRTSVFDIINSKLGGKGSTTRNGDDDDAKPTMNVSKSALRADTIQDLNLKNHQLSENIRLLQREVGKMEESQQRQSGNKRAYSLITAKLDAKRSELKKLQEAEKVVHGEQQKRRDAKKLCVF